MTIDDKIRDEKLQHDIDREAAKIFTSYLINMNIIQRRNITFQIIEQAKLTYSPLGKVLEKQKQLKIKEKNK